MAAPGQCPTSWAAPDYCSCDASRVPSACLLWGVPYQWLIITLVLWVLAAAANWVVDLLVALVGLTFRRYGRPEWTKMVRGTMVKHTTRMLRWGVFWAGMVTLQIPPEVYAILRYFLSIPFFILVFRFVNAAYDTLSKIVRDWIERHQARQKATASARPGPERDSRRIEPFADVFDDSEHVPDDGDKLLAEPNVSHASPISSLTQSSSNVFAHAVEEFIRVVKYITFILVFVLCLQTNNVPVVDFFKRATLLTLSVVFAAQPWLRNLVGGVLIFFDDKFTLGDTIRVVGMEGKVTSLTLRSTVLQRADNSLVFVPNSRLLEQPVANLSRRAARRLEVRVELSQGTSARQIRTLITELEHSLRALHPSLASHPSNVGRRDIVDDFFVVLDSMYVLLVSTATIGAERESRAFGEIQSEVMLAIYEKMEELGIRPASADLSPAALPASESGQPRLSEDIRPRQVESLDRGHIPPFSYLGLASDDYRNDDEDLSMTSLALLHEDALPSFSGAS